MPKCESVLTNKTMRHLLRKYKEKNYLLLLGDNVLIHIATNAIKQLMFGHVVHLIFLVMKMKVIVIAILIAVETSYVDMTIVVHTMNPSLTVVKGFQ